MAGCDGRRGAVGLLAAAALAAAPGPARAQMTCDPCVVGVALDGPWERNDEVRLGFEHGIADLVGPRFTVVFPVENRRVADWTVAGARGALDVLLADPTVDLVLAGGPMVSSQVLDRGELPKPVVAAFVLDPEAHGFPIALTASGERVSGVPNPSYVAFSGDPLNELRHFRQLAPFTRLTYVAHDEPWAALLEADLRRSAASLGVEMATVRAGVSVDAVIGGIAPDAEAVYLTPLRQLPPDGFDRLVRALRDRRLPTFSWWGRSEVDRGLLASIYLDTDLRRLGRRIALHVQRILSGEDAGALPVDFHRSQRLTLNMATARAAGLFPSWSVLIEAEVLHDRRDGARCLSLASAAREAVSADLDLAAFDQVLAAGRQTVRTARAALRPRVTASAVTETPAGNPVLRSVGLQPSWFAAGSVGVSQLLYSEPLLQVADAAVVWEPSTIRRRDRLRTVTVSAALEPGVTASEVVARLRPWLDARQAGWPVGYRYAFGGEEEASVRANQTIVEQLPVAALIIVLLLVGQFNSVRRTAIVLLTIPLGFIGVVAGLIVAQSYFGFMTLLGVVALTGIVINNAIILIDRIGIEIRRGLDPPRAIFEATQQRLRPILLTTVTTVASLFPL